jgi:flagellar basal-body rod protein FlgF|tara:strand:- start:2465 stop:3151 length:687 start_codon:yes stop_codon:yes gene_type:complete
MSNLNVPGHRKDLNTNFTSGFLHQINQYDTRVFAIHDGANGFSNKQGQLNPTGLETDIAINGSGFFMIQPKTGNPALSRRGDFSISNTGLLVDGAGSKVLDTGGAPLEIPENKKLIVSENGDVFIEPLNGVPGERQIIGTIGTSLGGSEEDPLVKSLDGHLRLSSGGIPDADQTAVLSQGFLESSNIDAVSELIGTMEDQRQFEINIKLISLSKEIDEGGSSLMRLPS